MFDDLEGKLIECRELRDALRHLEGLPAAGALLGKSVVEAAVGLLDINLGDLVLDGWIKHNELLAAGRRTQRAPAQPEDVVLAEHQITSTHHPSVEVYIDNQRVATLTFDLEVSLDLLGVVAVVSAGKLIAFRVGDATIRAELSMSGRVLVKRAMRCRIGALVPLGNGVALVKDAGPPERGLRSLRPWIRADRHVSDMSGAAWHPDPEGRHEFRYWSGTRWTEHVSDRGVASIDPLLASAPAGVQPLYSFDA
jgi:hypothetical protein